MMDFAAMLLSFTALFMLKISSLPEFYLMFYMGKVQNEEAWLFIVITRSVTAI